MSIPLNRMLMDLFWRLKDDDLKKSTRQLLQKCHDRLLEEYKEENYARAMTSLAYKTAEQLLKGYRS